MAARHFGLRSPTVGRQVERRSVPFEVRPGRLIAAAAIACAACGGGASRPAGSSDGAPHAEARELRNVLVLYRDGAYLRQHRTATLRRGVNAVAFRGVPRAIVPGTAQFRSLTSPGTRAVRWRYWSGRSTASDVLAELVGRPVIVSTGDGERTGTLVAVYASSIVVDTGDRQRGVMMIARPVEVRGRPPDTGAPPSQPRLLWWVDAPDAGEQTLEAAYAVEGLTWNIGYSLVLEPKPAERGWLQGWLSLGNQTGVDLTNASAIVVDGKLTIDPAPAATAPTPPAYGGTPVPPLPIPPERPPARITRVDAPIAVADGEQRQFSLLGDGARSVPAKVTKVYDPIGRKLDRASRKPVSGRGFGASDDDHVHITVELDLERAGLSPELPTGTVRVYERGEHGELLPMGTTQAFAAPPPKPASQRRGKARAPAPPPDVEASKARLAIGVAPQLSGRRRQTDFSYSEPKKRLVEEFRITIVNSSPAAARVLVREHLYRGLNWALAYHNDVGKLRKTAPQEIEFEADVPAKNEIEIMYRVVYTW